MEDYSYQYVEHNLPVIALSGIGQPSETEGVPSNNAFVQSAGIKVNINSPELPEPLSGALRQAFQDADGATFAWNGDGNPKLPGLHGFRCYNVGRSLSFPRRKAAPAPQAPSEDPGIPSTGSTSINHDLHSPLSPLSPTSPLFPDGLMTPLWLDKHQRAIASVLLCFFTVTADLSTATLKDNELKNEIANVKNALGRTGFRTRLAVVLVYERAAESTPDLDERISVIRRASGLDAKSAFFVLPEARTDTELASFALNVLSALQPVCVDYYRDLTKHARRKKGRGFLPPPTGAIARGSSSALTFQDWHARYEFKQGVFAEFRQEMDVAERHYAFAIEELFNPEGALEVTPMASQRWYEARELADVTAFRVLRCLLWRNMTSGAAESWSLYRERTRALIERRNEGAAGYELAAWESRWAECMAQLILHAKLPAFSMPEAQQPAGGNEHEVDESWVAIDIMSPPEKAFTTADRQIPFRSLHHAGYWYRMAIKWAAERYQGTGTQSQKNDSAADPSQPEVLNRIEHMDRASAHEFALRRQFRAQSQICIGHSQILAKLGRPGDALEVLIPVWHEMSWRSESWWDLAADVISELYEIAQQDHRPRLQAELRWEMMRNVFGDRFATRISTPVDDVTDGDTPIVLDAQRRLSPVIATFSFANEEGHVGDSMPCQLALTSVTNHGSSVFQVERVHMRFNGGARFLDIVHADGKQDSTQAEHVTEMGSDPDNTKKSTRTADLSFELGSTRVINFNVNLREVGRLQASSIRIEASFSDYTFHHTFSRPSDIIAPTWWLVGEQGLIPRSSDRDVTHVVNVLPKPPRLQILFGETKEQYLTSDEVALDVVLVNEENESVSGTVSLDMTSEILSAIDARWLDSAESADHNKQMQRPLNKLGSYDQIEHKLVFNAPAEAVNLAISILVEYTISNDPETPVRKTTTFNFKFVPPFELSFDLRPRYDPSPWPSFFSMPPSNASGQASGGIRQRWTLSARLSTLAIEALQIETLELKVAQTSENISCEIPSSSATADRPSIAPGTFQEHPLDFYTRKTSLEDRRPSNLSLTLSISWRRTSQSRAVSTTLAIATLHVPPAEPRVLCTAWPLPLPRAGPSAPSTESASGGDPSRTLTASGAGNVVENGRLVRYTIENPSLHHLVFTVAMDASDQFAFSGPKSRAVALPPLSRVDVPYRILALSAEGAEEAQEGDDGVGSKVAAQGGADEGGETGRKEKGKWVYPVLRVQDAYFMKSLRVLDAGPGVKPDARRMEDGRVGPGVGVWVPITDV